MVSYKVKGMVLLVIYGLSHETIMAAQGEQNYTPPTIQERKRMLQKAGLKDKPSEAKPSKAPNSSQYDKIDIPSQKLEIGEPLEEEVPVIDLPSEKIEMGPYREEHSSTHYQQAPREDATESLGEYELAMEAKQKRKKSKSPRVNVEELFWDEEGENVQQNEPDSTEQISERDRRGGPRRGMGRRKLNPYITEVERSSREGLSSSLEEMKRRQRHKKLKYRVPMAPFIQYEWEEGRKIADENLMKKIKTPPRYFHGKQTDIARLDLLPQKTIGKTGVELKMLKEFWENKPDRYVETPYVNHLVLLSIPSLSYLSLTGNGVKVAVMDNWFDLSLKKTSQKKHKYSPSTLNLHENFPEMVANLNYANAVSAIGHHANHVASIVESIANNSELQVINFQAENYNPTSNTSDPIPYLRGLDRARKSGKKPSFINLSLQFPSAEGQSLLDSELQDVFKEKLIQLANENIGIVLALGNDQASTADSQYLKSLVDLSKDPRMKGRMILVVASDFVDGDYAFADDISNYPGDEEDGKRIIAAPGTRILAAGAADIPLIKSGTSMAAPMVTGVCALIEEYLKKKFNVDEIDADIVFNILLDSAFDVNLNGQALGYKFGNGIVNPLGALKYIESPKMSLKLSDYFGEKKEKFKHLETPTDFQTLYIEGNLIARALHVGDTAIQDNFYDFSEYDNEMYRLNQKKESEGIHQNVERSGQRSRSSTLLVPGVSMPLIEPIAFLYDSNQSTIRGYMFEDSGTTFQNEHEGLYNVHVNKDVEKFVPILSRDEFITKYKEYLINKYGGLNAVIHNEVIGNFFPQSLIGLIALQQLAEDKYKLLALKYHLKKKYNIDLPMVFMKDGEIQVWSYNQREIAQLVHDIPNFLGMKYPELKNMGPVRTQIYLKFLNTLGYTLKGKLEFGQIKSWKKLQPKDIEPLP